MKKVKIFSAVLLFFTAQSLFPQNINSLIQQGLNKAYNLEIDSAEKIFNKIIDHYPQKPHGYYHVAQLHFWLYLGTRDPGEYLVFLKFAELAQEKIDKVLDDDKDNYAVSYIAGNLSSFKAMAHATNDATVDAFWASKKAVSYYEQTLELNPKFYDAYLGLGLFDYAMSFVPDFLKWAVNLTGLSSDKARGLRYIKTAYKKGNEQTEAAFHLAKIYTDYLADYDSAYIYIRSAIAQYPKNTLFHYQHAVTLIKDKQLDQALEELNTVIRLNNKKVPQITSLAYYRKGEIYFKKNQFNTALKNFEKFLNTSKELDFVGIASYHAAICNKMLKNDSEYEHYLTYAKSGNQDIFEDSYAKEKAEKYSEHEISPADLKLIKFKNYIDVGKSRTANDSLSAYLKNGNGYEQKTLAAAYLCEASLNLGRYADALSHSDELVKADPDNEKWVVPFGYLISAKANYGLGNRDEARAHLLKAEDENSYEFQDQIQAQIENLKRKLRKK